MFIVFSQVYNSKQNEVHVKGVKKVRSALHHRISNHLKKEKMLKNCIFHEPVIPCDTL